MIFVHIGGAGAPPGPSYSPWDVSALPANVSATLSDFGLIRGGGTDSTRIVTHPFTRSSGKYALRFFVARSGGSGSSPAVGIRIDPSTGGYLGSNTNGWSIFADNIGSNEGAFHNGTGTDLGNLGPANPGLEIMMELDLDAGEMYLGADGVWPLGQDPETNANPLYTGITGTITICADMYYGGSVALLKPSEFTYPATTGYIPGWPDP